MTQENADVDLNELLPDIPAPRWERLTDHHAFGEAAFELLKATAIYAHLAAGLLPIETTARNEARPTSH